MCDPYNTSFEIPTLHSITSDNFPKTKIMEVISSFLSRTQEKWWQVFIHIHRNTVALSQMSIHILVRTLLQTHIHTRTHSTNIPSFFPIRPQRSEFTLVFYNKSGRKRENKHLIWMASSCDFFFLVYLFPKIGKK